MTTLRAGRAAEYLAENTKGFMVVVEGHILEMAWLLVQRHSRLVLTEAGASVNTRAEQITQAWFGKRSMPAAHLLLSAYG